MFKMMMVAAGPPALISGQHHLQLQPTTTRPPLSEVRLTRLSPRSAGCKHSNAPFQ